MQSDSGSIKMIPLNRLVASKRNVRKTNTKSEIESLAASIAAVGILQNLGVLDRGNETFEVIAGGRRLAALKSLAKSGVIAKDFAVPCRVGEPDHAEEASLAENVMREALSVMDEVEAFAALKESGASIDDIARRFGCTLRHIEQRLALAHLSPRIRNAYRRGDINLDAARAFCINDDHAAQERVFKQMGKPITNARQIRNALTQGRVPAHDRLVRFVGLDVYETAGGRVVHDLFEEEAVFLNDRDLLHRLATDKAECLRDSILREGWGWTEIQFQHGQIDGIASERLRPSPKTLAAKERRKLDAAEDKIEKLETALENASGDSQLWADKEAAEVELNTLLEAAVIWDPALIAHAGAVIAVDHSGKPQITRGLIKRADLKIIDKLRRRMIASSSNSTESEEDVSRPSSDLPAPSDKTRLPQILAQQLSIERTLALRTELANDPYAALALLVYALGRESFRLGRVPGIGIHSRPIDLEDHATLEKARRRLGGQIPQTPEEHWNSCLANPVNELLQSLAILVAGTMNLTHRGGTAEDQHMQSMSDAISTALDLDMRQYWKPDAEFWSKAPKALLLDALAAAPVMAKLSETARTAKRAACAKMKKGELVQIALRDLDSVGWLPDILMTPPREGAFVVTADGEAALGNEAAA